jgi:molybdopterin-guanine dinucleotide biosynthesis protein A
MPGISVFRTLKPMTNDLTVALIAGGKSSRMGTDKSFVELAGTPLIEHLMARVDGLGRIILITNRPNDYAHLGLPMHRDVIPEKGSLGGIYSAIHHSQSEWTLTLACDMPFVSTDLLRYMIGLRDESLDVIVPRVENYPQGLHALYRRTCLDAIRAKIDADRLKVIGFYGDVRVRYLDESEYAEFDPAGKSFFNVNTPQELEEARQHYDA